MIDPLYLFVYTIYIEIGYLYTQTNKLPFKSWVLSWKLCVSSVVYVYLLSSSHYPSKCVSSVMLLSIRVKVGEAQPRMRITRLWAASGHCSAASLLILGPRGAHKLTNRQNTIPSWLLIRIDQDRKAFSMIYWVLLDHVVYPWMMLGAWCGLRARVWLRMGGGWGSKTSSQEAKLIVWAG